MTLIDSEDGTLVTAFKGFSVSAARIPRTGQSDRVRAAPGRIPPMKRITVCSKEVLTSRELGSLT